MTIRNNSRGVGPIPGEILVLGLIFFLIVVILWPSITSFIQSTETPDKCHKVVVGNPYTEGIIEIKNTKPFNTAGSTTLDIYLVTTDNKEAQKVSKAYSKIEKSILWLGFFKQITYDRELYNLSNIVPKSYKPSPGTIDAAAEIGLLYTLEFISAEGYILYAVVDLIITLETGKNLDEWIIEGIYEFGERVAKLLLEFPEMIYSGTQNLIIEAGKIWDNLS